MLGKAIPGALARSAGRAMGGKVGKLLPPNLFRGLKDRIEAALRKPAVPRQTRKGAESVDRSKLPGGQPYDPRFDWKQGP